MMDSAQMFGTSTNREYAGFWLRVVAYLIDSIILGVCQVPIFIVMVLIIGAMKNNGTDDQSMYGVALVLNLVAGLLGVLITLGYFAGFECTKQATPGKMALGLQVTDVAGNRISFLHAIGRNAGKIVSSMILCIGYVMSAFTERKQCLHDMMAGTLVVKKPR